MFINIFKWIYLKISPYVFGAVFLLTSLFIMLALLTYDKHDPSFNKIISEEKYINNLGGFYGAYLADPLLQVFGLSIMLPLIFLGILGGKLFLGLKSKWIYLKICVLLFCTPILAFSLSIIGLYLINDANLGGLIGTFLYNEAATAVSISKVTIPVITLSIIMSLLCLPLSNKESNAIIRFIVAKISFVIKTIIWLFRLLYKFIPSTKFEPEERFDEVLHVEHKPKVEIINKGKTPETKAPQQSKLKLDPNEFELPNTNLLKPVVDKSKKAQFSDSLLSQNSKVLQKVLEDFGIKGEMLKIHPGPVVTLYEFEPVAGTKSSRVIGLSDDIARSMSAVSARIAVIGGKSSLGIELPNTQREIVYLRELLESQQYQSQEDKLPLILGKNIAGEPVIADLSKMPHLLVAGTTGSGKSVAINTMILSLLYKHSPKECRFIMIDPKMLELSVYDGIPHLLAPVVTEPKKAIAALKWVVKEMENRYRLMALLGVRNIDGYNKMLLESVKNGKTMEKKLQVGFDINTGMPKYETLTIDNNPLPFIVVIVDEMADLMLVAGKDIESSIQRLAQMARAAGIHLIMATQRPSVDVITGVIKANFPTRISFQVTSKIDSRTILGEQGAEQLLGMGDMLYMRGGGRIERVHGPFVDDREVESIASFLKTQVPMMASSEAIVFEEENTDDSAFGNFNNSSGDELYDKAVQIVIKERKPTTSYIQRCLGIGYNRAANLIERMEKEGVISAPNHRGKREILVGED